MTTRSAVLGALAGVALLLGASGCSVAEKISGDPEAAADPAMAEACKVMATELEAAGYSFADLVPSDISEVDGSEMSQVYATGAQALEQSRRHVDDVTVGNIIDATAGAMAELSPIVEKASAGDPSAIADAQEPLGVLTATAKDCSTVVTL